MRTFLIILFLFSIFSFSQNSSPKRELRGVWLATVVNIDWPSSPKISPSEQIIELIKIFDKLDSAGINSVYFQIRTECDALYKSNYEPWSYWLTGKQGRNPEPYFDPLELAISFAHYRGMELHAWFNPYRAVRKTGEYITDSKHVSKTHPDWILTFGDLKMLNPGIPEVNEYINNIVKDVIENYDVDGIHFDDYFYPYSPQITNQDLSTFKKYGVNFKNIDDWRRNNINILIKSINQTIKSYNKRIKFGISPFGIVENKYAGSKGFESYNQIYCDPLNWIENEYVDYLTPQVYWEIGNKNAPYDKLTKWWAEISKPAQLYIGQFSSKYSATDFKKYRTEIPDQIKFNRKVKNVSGQALFSAKSIVLNYGGLYDTLKNNYFNYPALLPEMKNIDSIPPLAPVNIRVERNANNFQINWENPPVAEDGEEPEYYIIYGFSENESPNTENAARILDIVKKKKTNYFYVNIESSVKVIIIASLDRLQNESIDNAIINLK